MVDTAVNKQILDLKNTTIAIAKHLLKRWYLLFLAALAGFIISYMQARKERPVYTANFSFVLSTEQRGGNGIAGLAAQLGFDAMTSSPDNLFSGDNIIELFRSRSIIGAALLAEVDSVKHQTLLNFILQREHPALFKTLGPFNSSPAGYSLAQKRIYRNIISQVGNSFLVFKKDKKLIVYIISAKYPDPDIAYYIAKLVLDETSKYFIDTKTRVASNGVKLLQHEADSLARLLNNTYSATAAMNDRTYNLNPSVSIQRSGAMFNQAKVAAYGAAYTEVMRNLEVAKINLQKETPLYRIIDEPELPLSAAPTSKLKHIIIYMIAATLLMAVLLAAEYFYKTKYYNGNR